MTLVVAAYILLTYPKFILTGQSIMWIRILNIHYEKS
jgi:hypothetical protein